MYQSTKLLQKDYKIHLIFEHIRNILAQKGRDAEFLLTYRSQKRFFPDENTTVFWDRIFSDDLQLFPMEKWRLNLVVNKLLQCDKKILHLGCGSGKLERLLIKKCGVKVNLTSTDITIKTLRKLKDELPQVNFVKTRLEKLPFGKSSFDVVVLLEVLEHIKPDNTFKVLKEVNRVLSLGGLFVVSVPLNEGLEKILPSNPNSHMRIYTTSILFAELRLSGFKVVRYFQASAFHKFFYAKHVINRIFHFRQPNNVVVLAEKVQDNF